MMKDYNLLAKAVSISIQCHKNKKDKGGNPYIIHPFALMKSFDDIDKKIIAVLHDVVEDSDITFDMLKEKGFNDKIINALDGLTRRSDESYMDFIKRCSENELSSEIKLKDLKHNMDLSRIKEPSKKDYDRVNKYKKAEKYLLDKKGN